MLEFPLGQSNSGIVRALGQSRDDGASFDADARLFLIAAGITDNARKNAVGSLVKDLKSADLWTKLKAIYPMVGGTAAAHKFNLKDPADTDEAFRLAFSGGWIHSGSGAKPDGSTAYADTFFNPSTIIPENDGALGYYSRTDAITDAVDIGIQGANISLFEIHIYVGGFFNGSANTTFEYDSPELIANSETTGFYQAIRTGATTSVGQKNGDQSAFTDKQYRAPNGTALIGARRSTGGVPEFYTTKECAFAYFGAGLTAADGSALYTIVRAFQTALGRQT